MGKLYDEQMRKQAETQAFRERAFNSTKTDVVRNLLTSDNIYEGKDTRNLEQYLTERNYDISAIIAGTQEVPDTIFDPVKQTELRQQKKKESEDIIRQVSEKNRSRNWYDVVKTTPPTPELMQTSPQTLDDERPEIMVMEDSRINLMPLVVVGIVAIGIVYFILRGKK